MSSTIDGWEVVGDTRDRLGESALWHPQELALYWIDFYGPYVHRFDPANGQQRRWTLHATATVGSLAFAGDGRLLLAIEGGVHLFDAGDESLRLVSDPNAGRAEIGYNDAKVDRDGRYWVGTLDLPEKAPRGILYSLGRGGRVKIADSGFVVCNGPAFSPSGDRMYFSDTFGRKLLVYDVERASGTVSAPRLFADLSDGGGMPDGLCVDSAGAVYCAHYGGGRITRFSPEGAVLEVIPLPVRNVTSCCLGGPQLNVLYVTTAENGGSHQLDGALFARSVPVPGLPEPLWPGV
jgi:sugar lactone lactonase YvrE